MGSGRRKKKRTHNIKSTGEDGEGKNPKTFVIERGKVGSTLKQLVLDFRRVMEPHTATHLKATKKNVLKDFVSIAGPMGVTHFVLISKTSEHVYLKIARIPRGPTITFRISKFALGKDVVSMSKKPPPISNINYLTPPVLVLNNFAADSKPCQLMSSMLQNMYPTLDVQTVKLGDLRRCVMFSYDKTTELLEFRHYAIKVVPRGVSRGVRKIAQSRLPNLSHYEDISEYVLGGGASESEAEEAEGEVTLGQDVPGRGNVRQQQSSVKLYEVGPRLSLQLIKIEDGLCNGEVLHHELVQRTKEEIKALKKRITEQRRLKISRKKLQEDNVRRKQLEKDREKRQERLRQGKKAESEGEEPEEDMEDEAEYYRQEVGVAPDPDLLLSSRKVSKVSKDFKRKRKFPADTSDKRGTKRQRVSFDVPRRGGAHRPAHSNSRATATKRSSGHQSNGRKTTRPSTKRTVYTGTVFRKKSQRT